MYAARKLGHQGGVPEQWVGDWSRRDMFDLSVVGIHSGCFDGVWAKKKWNHFDDLIKMLLKNGFIIQNFGTEKEAQNIKDKNYHEHANKGWDLAHTIDEMMSCGYFISNDSGLMHIADALGIPTIAIFGPTLVTKNRPVGKHSLTIQASKGWKDDCIPCQYTPNFKYCQSNECLKNISAEFVYEQFVKLREELSERKS